MSILVNPLSMDMQMMFMGWVQWMCVFVVFCGGFFFFFFFFGGGGGGGRCI